MAELTNKVDLKNKNSTSSGMQKRKRWHSAPPAGVRGRLQHPVQTQEHSHVLCQAQQQSHGVWPDQGPHQHVSANNSFQCVFILRFTTSTSKIHPALLECTFGFRVVINWTLGMLLRGPQAVQRGRGHYPSILWVSSGAAGACLPSCLPQALWGTRLLPWVWIQDTATTRG